jgi:hypothetical protein
MAFSYDRMRDGWGCAIGHAVRGSTARPSGAQGYALGNRRASQNLKRRPK